MLAVFSDLFPPSLSETQKIVSYLFEFSPSVREPLWYTAAATLPSRMLSLLGGKPRAVGRRGKMLAA